MDSASSNFLATLHRSHSKTRLEAYRNGGTSTETLCRYCWNTAICESLYPSFQILEVSFRNAVHGEVNTFSNGWLDSGGSFLARQEQDEIAKARAAIVKRGKTATEDLLVAELKFGFWTSLLDSRYETMWHRIIKNVFPGMPKTIRTPREASARMNQIRKFRNAALHHHSIWHWGDLKQQHGDMHEMIGWVCHSSAVIARSLDRFPKIFEEGPKAFESIVLKFSN